MPSAIAPTTDEYALNAADNGGRYHPGSDSMAFAQAIPDEFPYLDFTTMEPSDIGFMASLLEEFAHRLQFQITHFGFLYRLASLIQVSKVLEVLAWLGESPNRRLPLPWKKVTAVDPRLTELIADLHTLEDFRRVLFGLPLEDGGSVGRFADALYRVKELVHEHTPITLQHFSTFGGLEEFYDPNGSVKVRKTTRAIVESHASAFAFETLRRLSPDNLDDDIGAFIKQNRRGLYRTVEDLAESVDLPVTLNLQGVLRLGDFALDGKLVDLPTIPPPEDYVESALPYSRYRGAMHRFEGLGEAAKRVGHGRLEMDQLIEAFIHMAGDDRGVGAQLGLDHADALNGRAIQLQKERAGLTHWLEHAQAAKPLSDFDTFIRREIAWSSQRFLQGNLSLAPDARRFDPTFNGLVTLCQLADLPTVVYPDALEIFRCEPQEIEMPFVAWRLCVHGVTTLAGMFMRSQADAVMEASMHLEALQAPGLSELANAFGFSVAQLA
jgi:hypothetical protein